jgi:hypothetical protein
VTPASRPSSTNRRGSGPPRSTSAWGSLTLGTGPARPDRRYRAPSSPGTPGSLQARHLAGRHRWPKRHLGLPRLIIHQTGPDPTRSVPSRPTQIGRVRTQRLTSGLVARPRGIRTPTAIRRLVLCAGLVGASWPAHVGCLVIGPRRHSWSPIPRCSRISPVGCRPARVATQPRRDGRGDMGGDRVHPVRLQPGRHGLGGLRGDALALPRTPTAQAISALRPPSAPTACSIPTACPSARRRTVQLRWAVPPRSVARCASMRAKAARRSSSVRGWPPVNRYIRLSRLVTLQSPCAANNHGSTQRWRPPRRGDQAAYQAAGTRAITVERAPATSSGRGLADCHHFEQWHRRETAPAVRPIR